MNTVQDIAAAHDRLAALHYFIATRASKSIVQAGYHEGMAKHLRNEARRWLSLTDDAVNELRARGWEPLP